MITSKAKHPNCTYKLMDHIISPEANVAGDRVLRRGAGELEGGCADAEKLTPDHCDTFHADDEAYFSKVWYWATPQSRVRRRPQRRDVQGLRRLGDRPGPRSRAEPPIRTIAGGRGRRGPPGRQRASMTRRPASAGSRPSPSGGRWLYRRPRVQLGLLLAAPVGWLVIAYLGSLAILFLNAFWTVDPFTGTRRSTSRRSTTSSRLATNAVYRTITRPDARRWRSPSR